MQLKVKEYGNYGSTVFNLHISNKGHISINHNMEYNPTCMDGIETFIFKCYANKTKITEIDDFDTSADCFYNPNRDF